MEYISMILTIIQKRAWFLCNLLIMIAIYLQTILFKISFWKEFGQKICSGNQMATKLHFNWQRWRQTTKLAAMVVSFSERENSKIKALRQSMNSILEDKTGWSVKRIFMLWPREAVSTTIISRYNVFLAQQCSQCQWPSVWWDGMNQYRSRAQLDCCMIVNLQSCRVIPKLLLSEPSPSPTADRILVPSRHRYPASVSRCHHHCWTSPGNHLIAETLKPNSDFPAPKVETSLSFPSSSSRRVPIKRRGHRHHLSIQTAKKECSTQQSQVPGSVYWWAEGDGLR